MGGLVGGQPGTHKKFSATIPLKSRGGQSRLNCFFNNICELFKKKLNSQFFV